MSQYENELNTFKLIVVGDSQVGKTCYVKRISKGTFENIYTPTIGVDFFPLEQRTNRGDITFQIWDMAGQDKFRGLEDRYYKGASACFIMFDLTSITSFKNLPKWISSVYRVCENIPIVICGNKADQKENKMRSKVIKIFVEKLTEKEPNIDYYEISARNCVNIDAPFLSIMRTLKKDPELNYLNAYDSEENSMDGDYEGDVIDEEFTDEEAKKEIQIETNQMIEQYDQYVNERMKEKILQDDIELFGDISRVEY